MVIPCNRTVKFFSGTSSLQGNIFRQLLLPSPNGFVWLQYSLAETSFLIRGPATALQVLQEISIHSIKDIGGHYIRSKILIENICKPKQATMARLVHAPDIFQDTWRGQTSLPRYIVDCYTRPSHAFDSDGPPPVDSLYKLVLQPDPLENLSRWEIEMAAYRAVQDYCSDISFSPTSITRCKHRAAIPVRTAGLLTLLTTFLWVRVRTRCRSQHAFHGLNKVERNVYRIQWRPIERTIGQSDR